VRGAASPLWATPSGWNRMGRRGHARAAFPVPPVVIKRTRAMPDGLSGHGAWPSRGFAKLGKITVVTIDEELRPFRLTCGKALSLRGGLT